MNSIEQVFHYQNRRVRAMQFADTLWFVAKDVCEVLGIRTNSVRFILDEDEVRDFNPNDNSIDICGAEAGRGELREVVADLTPKADFYDRVADISASFSLGETAKMLEIPGFGRNNLIRFLRDEGVLMADNVAKQRYIERGYFHIVQRDYYAPDGTPRVKAVTRVYEKGVDYIRHLMDDFMQCYTASANAGQ